MGKESKNKGWFVTFSGTAINLALGVLYTWSIFKGAIRASIEKGGVGSFNWDISKLNDPYSIACFVFAFSMILAGKLQDRFGPRLTAFIGGVLVGLGFVLISQTTAYILWVLGFGILVGAGIGFGYSAATPPALKWFPPRKTGLIAGIVVSGFGLASVYIAPLSEYLLKVWGIHNSMLFFGIAFFIIVCGLSLNLINPPPDFTPAKPGDNKSSDSGNRKENIGSCAISIDYTPLEMMKTPSFYLIWIVYFIGAGVGLMVISSVAGMAKSSLGEAAFVAVAILAVGNAAGRIVAGLLSDRIGRKQTLLVMLVFQSILMFAAIPVVGSKFGGPVLLVLIATFIGFNYGSNLSLFPSLTKDIYGLKNFGVNYGIVFTAWGVGGLVLSRLSQMLQARSGGKFSSSFIIAGILLIIGALLTLALKKPQTSKEPSR